MDLGYLPSRSKHPMFEATGSNNHTLNGFSSRDLNFGVSGPSGLDVLGSNQVRARETGVSKRLLVEAT